MMTDPRLRLKFGLTPGTIFTGGNGILKWQSSVSESQFLQDTDASRPYLRHDGAYFDGTKHLRMAHPLAIDFGAGNFTISLFVKFESLTGYRSLCSLQSVSTKFLGLRKNPDNTLQFFGVDTSTVADYTTTSAPSFATGQWYHILANRVGTLFYIFVNGVSQPLTIGTNISTMPTGAGDFRLGAEYDLSGLLNGTMTDIEIYKGVGLYTSNFVPPIRGQAGMAAQRFNPITHIPTALITQFDSGD